MPKTSDQMVSSTSRVELRREADGEGKQLSETLEEVKVEEMHICFICDGADKEGRNLSLAPEKINSTRYHYASCLYDYHSTVYYEMYDHDLTGLNKNPDGSPRDILGRMVRYNCFEGACSYKRGKTRGFKDFAIHKANEHEGLEEVLMNHQDERVRNLIPKLSRQTERIMNCFMCTEEWGRNMRSQQDIKYHMSMCAYGTGEFRKYVPNHQGADKEKTSDLEEFGRLRRYRCPFEGCDQNTGVYKSIGYTYEEFAIHSGEMHGVLERWAENSELDGAKELYKTLKGWREAEGKQLPEMPEVKVVKMLC